MLDRIEMSPTLESAFAQIASMSDVDQDRFGQVILDSVAEFEARQTDNRGDVDNLDLDLERHQDTKESPARESKKDKSGQ